MKKIEYENILNIETEYLKLLKLLDENKNFNEKYKKLNADWNKIQQNKSFPFLQKLPVEVKDLLICSYEKLVAYFIIVTQGIQNLKKEDINELKELFKKLEFNYENYKDLIANFFINNSDKLKIYSCFYCDCAYTGVFLRSKNKRRMFDVDHFFPNSQFPMFCLSLYNFVPNCQICNSRIKGSSSFYNFYSLDLNSLKLKDILLEISPISKNYDLNNNLTIKVYPKLKKFNQKTWNYKPLFSKNSEDYEIQFCINEKSNYNKVVKAFALEERYNNFAIKSQALYLMDLKRKYPNSNIKFLENIINKNLSEKSNRKEKFSAEEIRNDIFHKDNKYSLLKKLKTDIIDSEVF